MQGKGPEAGGDQQVQGSEPRPVKNKGARGLEQGPRSKQGINHVVPCRSE